MSRNSRGAQKKMIMAFARMNAPISLGPMTMPHRIARLVLAEQVYRGFTILRGEPYAREGKR